MTVEERGVQIIKAIHWILRDFRTAIILLDFIVQCGINHTIPGEGRV
jgi:hypothetical protein